MVRPTRPKDIKPKSDGSSGGEAQPSGGGGFGSNNLIIVNVVTTILICALFIGGNYFIQDNLLSSKLANIQAGQTNSDEGGDNQEEIEKGMILDLGEFILNLSDEKMRRYLKVNVAIELTRLATDPDPTAPSGGEGHGEHGGGVDPMKMIEIEMSQYKPAIRDAIISTLSSKTSEELSSIAGKELAKEQIKEAIDAIFAGKREVLRVSFGTFIIQ